MVGSTEKVAQSVWINLSGSRFPPGDVRPPGHCAGRGAFKRLHGLIVC